MLTTEQKCELIAVRGAIVEAREDLNYWDVEHEIALRQHMQTQQVFTGEMLTKANERLENLENRLHYLVGLRNEDK